MIRQILYIDKLFLLNSKGNFFKIMQIKTIIRENKDVVILSGELVGVDSLQLSKTLAQYKTSECNEIIIDLRDVKYMDSNCFGSLIYSKILLERNNKKVVLSAPKDDLNRIFRDCTFDQIFETIEAYE